MKKFLAAVVMFGMAATGCGSATTSGTTSPPPTKPTAVVTTPAPISTPTPRATTPAPAVTTPVPAEATAPAPPAGATALCNDGTFSYSATHSGSCSHHKGVAVFYQ